jgi:hypothetical protein
MVAISFGEGDLAVDIEGEAGPPSTNVDFAILVDEFGQSTLMERGVVVNTEFHLRTS